MGADFRSMFNTEWKKSGGSERGKCRVWNPWYRTQVNFWSPCYKNRTVSNKNLCRVNYNSLLLKAMFLHWCFLCKWIRHIAGTGLILHFHFYAVLFSHLFCCFSLQTQCLWPWCCGPSNMTEITWSYCPSFSRSSSFCCNDAMIKWRNAFIEQNVCRNKLVIGS